LPNHKIFGKFEKITHTQKYAKKRIDIDFERVSFVCALAGRRSQKWKTFSFSQVALAMRFQKNSLPDE